MNSSEAVKVDGNPCLNWTPVDWVRIRRGIGIHQDLERVAAQGIYHGGEELVEHSIGPGRVMPNTLDEIIRAGIQTLSRSMIRLHEPHEVQALVLTALQHHRGFALIRLGDGELLTLAQQTLLTDAEVRLAGGHFLSYAGVQLPDYSARNQLLQAVYEADVIGIPSQRSPTFQLLFLQVARVYGWRLGSMNFANSLINYTLQTTDLYAQLFRHWRVLLIGNRMAQFAQLFRSAGIHSIVATVPVSGVSSVEEVLHQVSVYDFDVALVSGGVAASILCPRLRAVGKVALDFGHLADQLITEQRVF